ncbi:MAG: electron transfer flavoprotein subunit alpha/FixB family protein [Spirochaetes bacterium]|nr:electron transfer flavoprotein subunit alpha/FixB family protein [Spirochaetota bacterium]
MGNVLTIGEIKAGALRKSSLEAASLGFTMAKALGGEAHGVVIGDQASSLAAQYKDSGVTKVFAAEGDAVKTYAPNAYAAVIAGIVKKGGYDTVIFPTSTFTRDLAAKVGAELKVMPVMDAVEAKADGGAVIVKRPAYAGKVMMALKLTGKPSVFGIRPNVFPVNANGTTVAVEKIAAADAGDKAKVTAQKMEARDEIPLTEANIIVSGGRTAEGKAIFDKIRPVAKIMNAAVGASRACVDAHMIEHSHQVGQTGTTVSPNLYIACAISGSIQHRAGMSSSKVIVAVNKDPEAPIFSVATYGVVADVYQFLPALEAELKKVMG